MLYLGRQYHTWTPSSADLLLQNWSSQLLSDCQAICHGRAGEDPLTRSIKRLEPCLCCGGYEARAVCVNDQLQDGSDRSSRALEGGRGCRVAMLEWVS
jgi:hypothetical protein